MRYRLLLLLPFALAACDHLSQSHTVDAATLPPMSGQERALMIAADSSAATGDFDTAERNYATAIAQSQGHVEAHIGLANLYLKRGEDEKASEVLTKALEFQPNNPEVNRLLGKIAIGENKPAEALQYFDAGLKSDPVNLDLLNGSAIANDLLHHHLAAQVIYLKALQLHAGEDVSMVKTNLAMSYLLTNKPKLAVDLLKADVKKPGSPPAMKYNLALAYGVLGRTAQARTLLNGELSEEEREQSVKRLQAHIALDAADVHPTINKPDKKPTPVSKFDVQPKVGSDYPH